MNASGRDWAFKRRNVGVFGGLFNFFVSLEARRKKEQRKDLLWRAIDLWGMDDDKIGFFFGWMWTRGGGQVTKIFWRRVTCWLDAACHWLLAGLTASQHQDTVAFCNQNSI
jgi:hypothetical protein